MVSNLNAERLSSQLSPIVYEFTTLTLAVKTAAKDDFVNSSKEIFDLFGVTAPEIDLANIAGDSLSVSVRDKNYSLKQQPFSKKTGPGV